jgi:hypothetical protein
MDVVLTAGCLAGRCQPTQFLACSLAKTAPRVPPLTITQHYAIAAALSDLLLLEIHESQLVAMARRRNAFLVVLC